MVLSNRSLSYKHFHWTPAAFPITLIFLLHTYLFLGTLATDVSSSLRGTYKAFTPSVASVTNVNGLWQPFESLFSLFSPQTKGNSEHHDKMNTTFRCTNGRNPKTLTTREQLSEFIRGPCSPVLLVPGHQASSLRILIDCPTLQAKRPDIFEACGWQHCDLEDTWTLKKPQPEYTLWIPTVGEPINFLHPNYQDSVCWSLLASLKYRKDKNGQVHYDSPEGTRVTWYGDTNETAKESECGNRAIRDLLNIASIEPGGSKNYKDFIAGLEDLGYVSGYSMQGLPYDFRKSMTTNGFEKTFKRTLDFIYRLTGKRVIVVAHSYGNLNVLHALNGMSSEEKDKKIRHYVAIAPPFTGSVKSLEVLIGGSPDYLMPLKIGLRMPGQRIFFNGMPSALDLFPQNPYTRFAGEPWMHEVKRLSGFEKIGLMWAKSSVLSFLPSNDERCHKSYHARKEECMLGIYDYEDQELAVIENRTFSLQRDDLIALVENYSLKFEDVDEQLQESERTGVFQLKNPEVPLSLLFYSHLNTSASVKWKENPRTKTFQDEPYFPDEKTRIPGDGVVSRGSALIAGVKWSYEFEKNTVKTARPVKIVDLCSQSKMRPEANIYDNLLKNGEKVVEKNEYMGWQCDCLDSKGNLVKGGEDCDHTGILQDSWVLKYLTEVVDTHDHNNKFEDTLAALMSDEELRKVGEECLVLRREEELEAIVTKYIGYLDVTYQQYKISHFI
eukprot:TRINITY_DN6918_c0_g1_i1.p1 TRINITY_DN6918_c0_g1~~TRINITY_DN6918_c0_g1_i1.p1  ORF type:complete len:723 (+),score=126.39 TRINITY_DN6918_c0_g1_i1:203-2371(+)